MLLKEKTFYHYIIILLVLFFQYNLSQLLSQLFPDFNLFFDQSKRDNAKDTDVKDTGIELACLFDCRHFLLVLSNDGFRGTLSDLVLLNGNDNVLA